jgi:hypothetical protein
MDRRFVIVLLALLAIGACGFSFYYTYFAASGTQVSAEERAAAFKKMKAFEHHTK